MVRYLISLVLFLTGAISAILLGGGRINVFLDIPSFLIIGILPFLFVSILYGFKEMGLAFSTAFENNADKEQLKKAINIFKIWGKTIWITSLIAILIGVMLMLVFLEDKNAIGPNLAVALISVLYAALLYVLIIIPFTVFLKNQLKE
jgi:flagellar motor component MotA